MKLGSNLIEAANRAEATALLIRCGYKVYRPEADDNGEDLVIRLPDGQLCPVQLKGRPLVDAPRYGGKGLWMLFPSARFDPTHTRRWYLVPHDALYAYVMARHGHAPKWNAAWSYPATPVHLFEFLASSEILPPAEAAIPSDAKAGC